MPLCIALLSRYPPLEGGIASRTYWLARGLAERGHQVHVITHPCSAAGEYRIPDSPEAHHEPTNLWIHRPEADVPWHLPEDKEHFIALLELTVEVIRQHRVEFIDTGYLIPYGVIGHLAKQLTGVRHVMRHGGSDIEKFVRRGVFRNLLSESISGADVIVTSEMHRALLEPLTRRVVTQPPYVPDPRAFARRNNNQQRHRLAVIGKVNYHWTHKSLDVAARIMAKLADQFECSVIGQGNGLHDFKRSLDTEVASALSWRPFVPPWQMPELLRQQDAIFILESGLPHPVFSNLALEAIYAGVGIVTDRDDFACTYREFVNLGDGQILVIPRADPFLAAEQIAVWVKQRAAPSCSADLVISYDEYIAMNQALYESLQS